MKDVKLTTAEDWAALHEAMSVRREDMDLIFARARLKGISEAAILGIKEAATKQPLSTQDFLARCILVLNHLSMSGDYVLNAISESPMPHLKLEYFEAIAYSRPSIVFMGGAAAKKDLHAFTFPNWGL